MFYSRYHRERERETWSEETDSQRVFAGERKRETQGEEGKLRRDDDR